MFDNLNRWMSTFFVSLKSYQGKSNPRNEAIIKKYQFGG